MRVLLLSLLVLCVAHAALGAAPPTPKWPQSFISEVSRYKGSIQPSMGEWYYSQAQKAERFDLMHKNHKDEEVYESYFALHAESPATGYALSTVHEHDGHTQFVCVKFPLQNNLFVPDFSQFTWQGTTQFPLNPPVEADHWERQNKTAHEAQDYFDGHADQRPIRIDRRKPDGSVEAVTFLNLIEAPVPASIFSLSSETRTQCHSVGGEQEAREVVAHFGENPSSWQDMATPGQHH